MTNEKVSESYIEGRNPVIEAFRSGKTIDKLYILDGANDGPIMTIKREAKKHDTYVKYVSKERLDQMSQTGTHQGVIACTAAYEYSEMELYRVIRDYGEDKFAKNIAKNIVKAREEKEIETTFELRDIIEKSIPKKFKVKGGHPAKRTFQAIRIELNRELDVLQGTIDTMIELLNDEGRLSIITFHSLEDRIVKSRFKTNENPCICPPEFPVCVCGRVSKGKVITRKPILPSPKEMEGNSRAKSAKLRVFKKKKESTANE